MFTVSVEDLVVSAEDLPALMAILKHNKYLHREYQGKGKGFAGNEYSYSYASHTRGDKIKVKPMDDALWLYLETFGKEEK
jgi:hypothetical protein